MQTANLQYEFKPPNKAYDSDIHARSGGEKTIAGLALIFALAQIKKVPMILLDEVDAHLDAQNVEQLGKYLEEWENRPQIMLISHQEKSVGRSQSLIGVTTQIYGSSVSSEGSDDQVNMN